MAISDPVEKRIFGLSFKKIKKIFKIPKTEEMGLLARKTILDQFDWRIVVKDAMKVYDETLD